MTCWHALNVVPRTLAIDSGTMHGDFARESSIVGGQEYAGKAETCDCAFPTFEIDGDVSRLLCGAGSSSEFMRDMIALFPYLMQYRHRS